MPITDHSKYCEKSASKANHAPYFPNNIFCVIAGATGCGKTNLMIDLLLSEEILDYGGVYIYTSTLNQDAYVYLKKQYSKIENELRTICKRNVKIANFFDADDEIKDPSELDPNMNHVMVFDDVMFNDQTKIKEYFCKGRHNNVNVFYLCQSLHKIAKHCIRDNTNVFILFEQDVKYFHETHIRKDMKFKEFEDFCNNAWSKDHGFIVINLWEKPYCGKYISNYEDIYVPKKCIKMLKNT